MTETTGRIQLPSAAPVASDVPRAHQENPDLEISWRQRIPILVLMAVFSGLLFTASATRHHLFRSGAMDLGFFDQLTYLISRGQAPISSILGFHLLADHAAYTLYLLAPLYWIWPNAQMLLIAQAIALASGAYPLWRIAHLRGMGEAQALAVSLTYLLYPIVLTANLFDFHPEVISVPALLYAVLAAKERKMFGFILALGVALGGKEIISLTLVAMGVWLFFFENRRPYGVVALILGVGWFLFATQWLIPHFGAGKQASGVSYFAYLGATVPQIVGNLILKPWLWIKVVFSLETAKYVCILFLPVVWGLSRKHLAPLLVALPTLALNILAQSDQINLRNPFGQYSLMVVPFLALAIVYAVAAGDTWLKRPVAISAWAIGLVALGGAVRFARASSHQTSDFANQVAVREAIRQINGRGGVLTTHEIAPHVSQRGMVQYIAPERDLASVGSFEFVLLNLTDDSSKSAADLTMSILAQVKEDPRFKLEYEKDWIYLFRRVPASPAEPGATAETEP